MNRPAVLTLTALLGLAAAAAVVVWPTTPPRPRHVVLVSLDTVRADVIGAWGQTDAHTPTLDALAAEGVLFEHHVSAAPTTLASHVTLFTGQHPHTHGVPRNDHFVHADNAMLQDVLGEAGFQTAAFLGAMPLASHSGFPEGFEHLDEAFSIARDQRVIDQTQRTGAEVTDAALAWVSERDDDRPLFLFVHYFDAHAPYLPEPRFLAMHRPGPMKQGGQFAHIARTRHLLAQTDPRAVRHVEHLTRRYRAGVSQVDHELGRLLDGLGGQGLLDDALVVVVSDHGETFASHPEEVFDHGRTLYDETIRTPLLLRFPQGWQAGLRVTEPVSSTDLFPSLLALLDLPDRDVDGVSWVPELTSPWLAPARGPVFAEATKPHVVPRQGWQNDPMRKAVRSGADKLIMDPIERTYRLYDVGSDPGEVRPITDDASTARQLLDVLSAWRRRADPLESPRVSDERIEAELAVLGYVDDTDAPRADTDIVPLDTDEDPPGDTDPSQSD